MYSGNCHIMSKPYLIGMFRDPLPDFPDTTSGLLDYLRVLAFALRPDTASPARNVCNG